MVNDPTVADTVTSGDRLRRDETSAIAAQELTHTQDSGIFLTRGEVSALRLT